MLGYGGPGGGGVGGVEVKQSIWFVVSDERHDASVTVSQGCSRFIDKGLLQIMLQKALINEKV